jgi:ribosomal protein L28
MYKITERNLANCKNYSWVFNNKNNSMEIYVCAEDLKIVAKIALMT